MKCPKYIKRKLLTRRRAAERFLDLDYEISEWLEAHGLREETESDAFGCVDALLNAAGCEKRILAAIERRRNDIY